MYGEFSFVFIGDNGQGDVLAAELVRGDRCCVECVLCCGCGCGWCAACMLACLAFQRGHVVQMAADEGTRTTVSIIHKVIPVHQTLTSYMDLTLDERREEWALNNIFFVDTCVTQGAHWLAVAITW